MQAQEQSGNIDVVRDYGHSLQYEAVVSGLRDLNAGIHADMGGALGMWHPHIEKMAGLYYEGRHITAIDRGSIPEFKVWSLVDGMQEIPPEHAARHENARLTRTEITPDAPDFFLGITKSADYSDGYAWEEAMDGSGREALYRYRCHVPGKVRGKVIKVGWRHTFERVIRANVPNLTRQAIATKFGVDLSYVPTDMHAAFVEE